MTNDVFIWILVVLAGMLLGIFFFGGLWWTIQKGLASKYAGLWFFGSLVVRTGVLLTGFILISNGHWERMIFCLIGFIMARFVVLRLKRANEQQFETTKIAEP